MARPDLTLIIANFVGQLGTIIEDLASARIRAALDGAFVPLARPIGKQRRKPRRACRKKPRRALR